MVRRSGTGSSRMIVIWLSRDETLQVLSNKGNSLT
jgi:hypothetical protein